MGAGSSISWGSIDETGSSAYKAAMDASSSASAAQNAASAAQRAANLAQSTANAAQRAANLASADAASASSTANAAKREAVAAAENLVDQLASGNYYGHTFINGTTISAPLLAGNISVAGTFVGNEFRARVGTGDRGGFVLSTDMNGEVFRICYDTGAFWNPITTIYGNGGTLRFSGWSKIEGISSNAVFA